MQATFESLSIQFSNESFIPSAPLSIHVLPEELLLKLFQTLNLEAASTVRAVCRKWTPIANDPSTIYGQHLKEINAYLRLLSLPPQFSAWMPMPQHWGLYMAQRSLKFSSIKENIIAFHPSCCEQSSNFFSFTSPPAFSNRYVFLSQYDNTYFLTPQGKTSLELELPNDLQPLESHKLVAISIKDPSKKCEFSLLKNLPSTTENLSKHQIKHCFPISENNIALISSSGEISFWDLLNETPHCYKELQINYWSNVYKIGNQLIFDRKIVDLNNPSLLDHGFEFDRRYESIKTFESSFCAYNRNKKEIRYFILNEFGQLEKKWEVADSKLLDFLDQTYGQFISLSLKDINEKFILLTCTHSKAVSMIIMNTAGEIIQIVKEELPNLEVEYPLFAHLSDNVLVYKNPQDYTVNIWYIPTQKYIYRFDLKKSIYDLPTLLGKCYMQDIRLSKEKLTILLSTEHTSGSSKPGKFRLIQFDSQNIHQGGISGIFNSIYSTLKGIYYAFPGEVLHKKF